MNHTIRPTSVTTPGMAARGSLRRDHAAFQMADGFCDDASLRLLKGVKPGELRD